MILKKQQSVPGVKKEEGTEEGQCPFMVYRLTGTTLEHLGKQCPHQIKLCAVKHFKLGGKVLGIGQAKHSESLYNNPQLYPQMFPWLFPYGLGGLKNMAGIVEGEKCRILVSEERRKQQLLMYHDKRFQLEPLFPLVALNYEQIKEPTSAGYLLADKKQFNEIADRLLNISNETLTSLIERGA